MSGETRVRPVAEGDWDGIVALEAEAYEPLGLSEDRAALESRVRASPATCFVLEAGGRPVGYLLALPYPASAYPDLTRPEETSFRTGNLHLHDLVVAAGLRGRGLGTRLLRHLCEVAAARAYEQISLIAVGGSDTYWAANGFTARPDLAPEAGYGADPVYMTRAVTADRTREPMPTGAVPHREPSPDEVG